VKHVSCAKASQFMRTDFWSYLNVLNLPFSYHIPLGLSCFVTNWTHGLPLLHELQYASCGYLQINHQMHFKFSFLQRIRQWTLTVELYTLLQEWWKSDLMTKNDDSEFFFLQAYLLNYSLLRGVTFRVPPLKHLAQWCCHCWKHLWNSCCGIAFLYVFSMLKSWSL
jgi:hypothetical protein